MEAEPPNRAPVMLNLRLTCYDDIRLKYAVARLNKENPGAEPIVLEKLTEQERATLVHDEKEDERALAPPPPEPEEEDLDEDYWQDRYDSIRDSLVKRKQQRHKNFCFEGTTRIPAMCFTDNPMPDHTGHETTMQFFTVKIEGIDEGLAWPLDVFGFIAVHDKLDYSRNIVFSRTRDNPQTLTRQFFTMELMKVISRQGADNLLRLATAAATTSSAAGGRAGRRILAITDAATVDPEEEDMETDDAGN
ncbi:hypothetical protein QYE76_003612 [Lolium multiflorum]|uniref:DUF6598 domain-containing protein n=1 Tax=Lolium multiflorum TaxID=4521 RepID=A0AAD8VZE1_LOLMU|nr:hypothetical protein QYE76_003612 [Lolium multiflorum]